MLVSQSPNIQHSHGIFEKAPNKAIFTFLWLTPLFFRRLVNTNICSSIYFYFFTTDCILKTEILQILLFCSPPPHSNLNIFAVNMWQHLGSSPSILTYVYINSRSADWIPYVTFYLVCAHTKYKLALWSSKGDPSICESRNIPIPIWNQPCLLQDSCLQVLGQCVLFLLVDDSNKRCPHLASKAPFIHWRAVDWENCVLASMWFLAAFSICLC